MQFSDVTFVGEPLVDLALLAGLPSDLAQILRGSNGLVAFRGGFHLRGVGQGPTWHSLAAACYGPHALFQRYPAVRWTDIPFAEDCCGDQFVWRDNGVYRLEAETGDFQSLDVDLLGFLAAVCAAPVDFLNLAPLLAFEQTGGRLAPGELLSVYPPFMTETVAPRSYRAVPAEERQAWLADLAEQVRGLPEGAPLHLRIVP